MVLVTSSGTEVVARVLVGRSGANLALVDVLARSQLAARRGGASLRLVDPSPELLALLELVGLRREVGGEAEGPEEGLGVQEGVEGGDPAPRDLEDLE
jgi:hypothetical protein